jgi:chromosome partitioning protein
MNSAGGVGRSTIALSLAVAFSEYGRKTLLVDCDPQGALTFTLGKESSLRNVYDIYAGRSRALGMIHQTQERVDFIPSSPNLCKVTTLKNREVLFHALNTFAYDMIVIDSGSGFSEVNESVLSAADEIIIPTRLDLVSVRGVLQVAQASKNYRGKVHAILPNNVEARSKHGNEMLDELRAKFGRLVVEPGIPKTSLIPDAVVAGQSLLNYRQTSEIAGRFREITYDLL